MSSILNQYGKQMARGREKESMYASAPQGSTAFGAPWKREKGRPAFVPSSVHLFSSSSCLTATRRGLSGGLLSSITFQNLGFVCTRRLLFKCRQKVRTEQKAAFTVSVLTVQASLRAEPFDFSMKDCN